VLLFKQKTLPRKMLFEELEDREDPEGLKRKPFPRAV
jgi:hypothetical protein